MGNTNNLKKRRNNVKTLGWVAFFGGFGQDMIQPVLPVFYSTVLGLNKQTIGLIEGSLTTIVSVFKILSGILSDRIGKRKSIVFIGYFLSAISRFLFGFVFSAWQAFILRFMDGIGKGTKDAPRDVLVAQSAKEGKMGFSFVLIGLFVTENATDVSKGYSKFDFSILVVYQTELAESR